MTVPELITYAGTFLTGVVPTLGLVMRERAKRQTADARAVLGALSMATEALARAKRVEEKADECEEGREECERRTAALYTELTKLRHELESSGALTKSDPDRPTPPEVIEAWSERFAARHPGAESKP